MAKGSSKQDNGFTVSMLLEKETKGALRYQECDAEGAAVEFANAKIGTLYIRKSAYGAGTMPKAISVTVQA